MERRLNLIKSEHKQVEKRVFPRFPFNYLTFRPESGENKIFEVVDISHSGMQVRLKSGGHQHKIDDSIKGELHWRGIEGAIKGKVCWVKGMSIGINFNSDEKNQKNIRNFLSIDNIINSMRPIHEEELDIEIPNNLKYWLRSDGPFELFVWCHNDGELSRFQTIIMDYFIEWEDGQGLRSGHVTSKVDLESPLVEEDEFTFEMDQAVCETKLKFATSLVTEIPERLIPAKSKEFILIKLGL